MRSRSRTLVSAGLVAGLLVAAGAVTLLPETARRAAAEALPPYASCDALLAHYRAQLERTATPYGLGGGGMPHARLFGEEAAADSAAAPAAAESAPTGTNLQEAAVDEPDLAKTVDGLLFTISERNLEVVRTGPQPERVGSAALPGDTWGAELLVDGDRVLVLGSGFTPGGGGLAGDQPAGSRMVMPMAGRTSALLFDVADPTRPRLVERFDLDGRYLSARLSGGTVRLVTSSVPELAGVQPQEPYSPAEEAASLARNRELARGATLEDVLPQSVRRGPDGAVLAAGPAVECGQVRHASSPQGVSTLLVTTLDLSAGLAAQDRTGVTTDGELVYASTDRLYVATSRWGTGPQPLNSRPAAQPDEVTTELHGFDTTVAGRTTYAGTGSVPGYVLGRWALSAYDGHLRVAVTSSPPWGGEGQGQASSSSVVVLAERGGGLVQTGRVDGLGVGETIHAVRYFGDLATVVTFRQTDPLYVLDLTDPAAPKLLGELKVPGFSTYLHPVGENLLLGVGQEADAATGAVTGMQVSLFDLTDRSRPTQVDRLQLGRVESAALHDSRAFGYDATTGTALMSVWPWDGTQAGVVGIRVQGRELVEAGRLRAGPPQLGAAPPERVLQDGTHLYAVSRGGVQAADLVTFTATGELDFGR